jgi:hypothetical protein
MTRLVSVGILLLAGCQSINGPVKRSYNPPPPVDAPYTSVGEQARRSRDQLAFPDGSPAVGPRTGAEIPANGR